MKYIKILLIIIVIVSVSIDYGNTHTDQQNTAGGFSKTNEKGKSLDKKDYGSDFIRIDAYGNCGFM